MGPCPRRSKRSPISNSGIPKLAIGRGRNPFPSNASLDQGLTLVNFSAQLERLLTQNTP